MATRVRVHELGEDVASGLAQLRVEPDGEGDRLAAGAPLGDGEVLVRVCAAAVNFPDLLMTYGAYQHRPKLPYTPGTEAAGVVERCGRGVTRFAAGDRVMLGGSSGMMRSFVVAAERACALLPRELSLAEGAAFSVAYSTAFHCLVERAALAPSDAVLVNGATGGVGLAAVQIARAVGCRAVIATGTSAARLAAARASGASAAVDFAETPVGDLAAAVKGLTGGRGVDVVYDPVGGEIFEQSLRATAWGARVAVVGFAGGDNARAVRANYALIKGLSLLGCRAGESVVRGLADPARRMSQLRAWIREGKLRPHVSHVYDVSDVRGAFEVLRAREVVGKAVVTFGEEATATSKL